MYVVVRKAMGLLLGDLPSNKRRFLQHLKDFPFSLESDGKGDRRNPVTALLRFKNE